MKILSVSHYFTPHIGGLEIVAKHQVKSLVENGYVVSVITCAASGETVGSTQEDCFSVYRARAINFFDKHFAIPFPIGGIGLIVKIRREVLSSDVVHVHDAFYQTSWLAYFFARLYKKPVFLTQHVGMVSHKSKIVMFVQRIVYATIGKLIFRYSRKIIVYNDNVRKFLEQYGVNRSKILELRNGIDLALFHKVSENEKNKLRLHFNLPINQPTVLFVGRLVHKKGFATLFEAHSSKYNIVFAGPGEVPAKWRDTQGVYFMGAMNQNELAKLYSTADIFAFPAQGEILTLAMQEAMASGLPVITTNDPAYLKYDINHDLISFIEPTATKLKDEIEKIISDKQLYNKMSYYSLQLAQKWFDSKKNIEEIINLYDNLKQKQRSVVVTTSWDDGYIFDMKLANLLKKYGIKGTFYISPEYSYIPADKRLNKEQIIKLSEEFEIGAHTMTHPNLKCIDDETARKEIVESKKYLENILKKEVSSFCYPSGYYNEKHKVIIKEAGFILARTVERFRINIGNDYFALPTTIHAYRHWSDIFSIFKHSGAINFFKQYLNWDEFAISLFDETISQGGVFHLWGHSLEIENHKDWDRLERVLSHIANKIGVQYVTNGEIL